MTNTMILILTVNFPFLDGDVLRVPSNGVYVSQFFVCLQEMSSNLADFNARNKTLTVQQGYQYHKHFSKFNRRHYELVSKHNAKQRTLLLKGLRNLNFIVSVYV